MSQDRNFNAPRRTNEGDMGAGALTTASVERDRAISMEHMAFLMAAQRPRDEGRAAALVLQDCEAQGLADEASYLYPRGNTLVQGPSIRLMEAVARRWGNLQWGTIELSRTPTSATVRAYARDLETNNLAHRDFEVPLIRFTQKGSSALTDPRDIYEAIQSQASRRVRACLQQLIPGDIVAQAMNACELRLAASLGDLNLARGKMVAAFEAIGVSESMLVARLGCPVKDAKPADITRMRRLRNAIQQNEATIEALFGTAAAGRRRPAPGAERQQIARDRPVSGPDSAPPAATLDEDPSDAPGDDDEGGLPAKLMEQIAAATTLDALGEIAEVIEGVNSPRTRVTLSKALTQRIGEVQAAQTGGGS